MSLIKVKGAENSFDDVNPQRIETTPFVFYEMHDKDSYS